MYSTSPLAEAVITDTYVAMGTYLHIVEGLRLILSGSPVGPIVAPIADGEAGLILGHVNAIITHPTHERSQR